jgi:hypothetical protein
MIYTVSAVVRADVGFPLPTKPARAVTVNVMSDTTAPKTPRDSTLFKVESHRLPTSRWVRVLRWWLPGILCLLGAVLLVVNGFDLFGVSAFAAFVGAGSSIWLTNFLWRLGVSGDDERDREAEGRVYLAKHGHWPDEEQ